MEEIVEFDKEANQYKLLGSVRTPHSGNYISGSTPKPTKLEGAMEISIPAKTLEPWQVHYKPFKECIIVKKGELFVRRAIFEDNGVVISNDKIYVVDDEISIPAYVPHQLGNLEDSKLDFIVEYSPGPKWIEEMEPEFPSLNSCLSGLYKELIQIAKK